MPVLLLVAILAHALPHSFVQVESDKTELYIDRSGRSKRTDQLHPITLRVPRERDEMAIVLSGEDCVVCC